MKNSFESYINSFNEYLAYELSYSPKTIKTYTQELKNYQKFLEEKKLNFLNINHANAIQYKAYLISKEFDAKTSSLHLTATRQFYNYLVEIKATTTNPFLNMKNPKIAKKLPNFLKDSETKKLFENIDYEDDLKVRNVFIIEFLYATGLRVSELCNIKLSAINFNDKTIRVLGKGSKERIIYYKAIDEKLLSHYLNISRPNILEGNTSEYLITSKSGKALSTRSVELIVKKYCEQKGIKNKVTPHTMRHSYATALLDNDADIRSVGELLGHESLDTTQIYTHVTSERLKKVYNNAHPRAKKD